MKLEYCVYCVDCKVFMDLGPYDYITGHFQGPFIAVEDQYVDSDLALKSFLEKHSGHRVGLEFDFQRRNGWYQVAPKTSFCVVFESDEVMMQPYMEKKITLRQHLQRIGKTFESFKYRLLKNSFLKPVKGKINLLSIVDVYGWAWDITSHELFDSLPDEYEGYVVSKDDFKRFKVNPLKYDVVICWAFNDREILEALHPENTILCVAGWSRIDDVAITKKQRPFKYIAAASTNLAVALSKKFPSRKIRVLSHGVRTDFFKPVNRSPNEKFIVGWVGNTKRETKRFKKAYYAVSCVDGARLEVAGTVGTVAGSAGIRIYRTREGMPSFYQGLDCLLVTSSVEVHPLVVYEAMSCGLPVICTRVGDVEENIVDGVNGILVDIECSINRVAEELNRLKMSPELRKSLGDNARNTVLEKWTWNKVAEDYVEAFREVLE